MNLFELFASLTLDTKPYEDEMNEAEKKTATFGDKLKSGLQTASRVTAGAVTAVAGASAALSGALVKGASDVASYGDNIDKASQKMGISAEAYQEWDAILQHSGTSIESLRTSMKTLSSAVETGSDAFEKLGISSEEFTKLSQEDLFSKVISSLQEMEEGTERTYITSQLLGRGATELGALLNTSAEDTEAMRKRVHELGGVLSGSAVKSAARFQDSLQDMQTAFSGIKRGITSDMLPGLSSLMEGFTSLIVGEEGAQESLQTGFDSVLANINSGLQKLSGIGQTLLPVIVQSITENLPVLATSGVEMINFITTTLIENLPLLLESMLSILQSIGNGIIENLPVLLESVTQAITEIALMLSNPETLTSLLETVLTIITTLAQSVIENLPLLIDTTLQVLNNLVDFIIENLPMFIDTAVQIIAALADGLIAAIPQLIEQAPVIIDNLVNALLRMLPQLVDTGIKLLVALIEDLPYIITTIVTALPRIITSISDKLIGMIPQIVETGVTLLTSLIDNLPLIIRTITAALPQIITSLMSTLTGMIPRIIQAGVTLLTSLVTNLPQIISTIVRQLPQIISAIVGGIVGAIPQLITAGGQLIQGLWQGISNVGEWLREKISGFFGGVVQSIKNFFGIKSPSKVFAGIGEMLDRGLAKGIGDYADLAVDEASNMAEDVFGATDRDFDFTATGNARTAQSRGVVINVYGAEGQDVNELAEIISQKIAFGYAQEQAVWA